MAAQKMTMAEYAAHRQVSLVAVSKAARSGRLSAGVTKDLLPNGTEKYLFDPVICDAEWIENAKQKDRVRRTENPTPIPRGRQTEEYARAAEIIKRDAKERKAAAKAQKEAQKPGSVIVEQSIGEGQNKATGAKETAKLGRPPKIQPVTGENPKPVSELSITQRKLLADTLKAEAQAEREQIALRRDKGELVEVEKFEDEYSGMIAKARDLLLHLPKSFRVAHQDAPSDYADWIDERIDSILRSLSGVQIDG